MICEKHPPPASHATDPEALALVAVATGLADGIKTLVPECTVGVVAGIHSEWQLLAQRGPIDIATTWRPSLANRVRASDRAGRRPTISSHPSRRSACTSCSC